MKKPTLEVDYQKLYDTLPHALIVIKADDPAFTIISQNTLHEQYGGRPRSETIGKPVMEVWPDLSEKYTQTGVSDLLESFRRVIKTGKKDELAIFNYDIKGSDGKIIEKYWRATNYPYFDAKGKVVAIFQTVIDITDEQGITARLQRIEHDLQEALSSGLIGAWLWDVEKDIVIGDQYMAALFGVPIAEATAGLPLESFTAAIHPDDRLRVQKDISRAFKNNTVFISEYRAVRNDGTVRWLAARGRIERDDNGKPTKFPGVFIDITDRKVAELNRITLQEDLRQANEQLERRVDERTAQLGLTNTNLQRSNQELQDFAYVASHDLQEPLRKIQAFGNLLQEEYGDKLGDGIDYLERMRGAAARMSALIDDILEFSRVTTRGNGFKPVNLTKVAEEVIDDLETRIDETKARVILENLPTIDADAMQMRQLLQNLLANALKFHKPGTPPVVKISAKVDISQNSRKKHFILTVQDNGVGFDEKYLDRIFAVFQRLHGRDTYEGTGIGLAVCRKIVERHGGTITARSKPGKGTTFIVILPMHQRRRTTQGDKE